MIQDWDRSESVCLPTDGAASLEATLDEADLLRRLKEKDERAYADLLELAGPRLLRLARRMMGCDDAGEDAFQDAMLSAFKAIGRFDGKCRLTTWLHRITVNACLMKLRGRPRKAEHSLEELMPSFQEDGHHERAPARWRPTAVVEVESSEIRELVRARIEELPPQYRAVLVLRDLEGFDTARTAAILETTEEAVKMRLFRARLALKALLEPHFADGVP